MSKTYLNQSQRDPKYRNLKMGNSNSTIGAFGCLVTSIANLFQKTVLEILDTCKFDEYGQIYWNTAKTDAWRFIRLSNSFERSEIRRLSANPNAGVILKVKSRLAPTTGHWVLLERLGFLGYWTIDPYPLNNQDQTKAIRKFYSIFDTLKHAEFRK
jgi:hypothetical protein